MTEQARRIKWILPVISNGGSVYIRWWLEQKSSKMLCLGHEWDDLGCWCCAHPGEWRVFYHDPHMWLQLVVRFWGPRIHLQKNIHTLTVDCGQRFHLIEPINVFVLRCWWLWHRRSIDSEHILSSMKLSLYSTSENWYLSAESWKLSRLSWKWIWTVSFFIQLWMEWSLQSLMDIHFWSYNGKMAIDKTPEIYCPLGATLRISTRPLITFCMEY